MVILFLAFAGVLAGSFHVVADRWLSRRTRRRRRAAPAPWYWDIGEVYEI